MTTVSVILRSISSYLASACFIRFSSPDFISATNLSIPERKSLILACNSFCASFSGVPLTVEVESSTTANFPFSSTNVAMNGAFSPGATRTGSTTSSEKRRVRRAGAFCVPFKAKDPFCTKALSNGAASFTPYS